MSQSGESTGDEPVVRCAAGAFTGTVRDGVRLFAGIRYAQAPVGEARWRDPRPVPAPEGLVDATRFGAVAPQQVNKAMDLGPDPVMDEDCLFLNVWVPADADPHGLPVMVWVHGGAYTFGSGSQPLYDARRLATAGDVVVVTINYRIGGLGFLDLSGFSSGDHVFDGNLALKDVLAALEWVQENIEAFGGDPARVTVFGESAGGGLVTTLLATPRAEGLVHRVIAESSPVSSVYGRERSQRVADRFLSLLGEHDPARLRDVPAERIVDAATRVFAQIPAADPGTIAFSPIIDGDLVPESPITVLAEGRALPVPLLIGTNKDEASFFRFMKSPLLPITDEQIDRMFVDLKVEDPLLTLPEMEQVRAAYEDTRHRAMGLGIARDVGFRMPTLWAVEGHSRVAPTYLYRFDHATPFLRMVGLGATHGSELPYVWGAVDGPTKGPVFRLGGRHAAQRISHRVMRRWTAFAHGDTPDTADAVSWPPFDGDRRATLVIDGVDRVVDDLDATLRAGWGDEVLAFT
ncbi:carboxylesterase/lipase family protein [Microbacterium aquimaris]|uniref:carboxylesterase/lipase family protein n=1 Tax=Microbacterium aquimaris TaxID=459816 RepID=UPI002AD212E0|nr:carboxylesterase/lipase family protein [Microbacterium aquimaris]MDZ8276749.1 carboxylesterase/lipase family protein [Microbacterium aquimaris]